MIRLSGLEIKDDKNPNGDIKVEFNGLRPGEKLYEELLIGDNVSGTSHQLIMRAQEEALNWEETLKYLTKLHDNCIHYNCDLVKKSLLELPTDYKSAHKIEDLVWSKKKGKMKLKLVTH